MPRFSIASMIAVIAVVALGLASLVYASSPWEVATVVAFYLALGVAPIGIMSGHPARRAFCLGFSVWVWGYAILTNLPDENPKFVVKHVLDWSFPRIVPLSRQNDPSAFTKVPIPQTSRLADGQRDDTVIGERVNIYLDGLLTFESVLPVEITIPRDQSIVWVWVRKDEAEVLARALDEGKKVRFGRSTETGSQRFYVNRDEFHKIGMPVLGLLAGLTGGLLAVGLVGRPVRNEAGSAAHTSQGTRMEGS